MTNEELRSARIAEAKRRWNRNDPRPGVEILADLYESNWTPVNPPEVVVHPDLLAAREWFREPASHVPGVEVDLGDCDDWLAMRAYLAGIKHGRQS